MSRYFLISIIFLALIIGSLALDGTFQIPSVWYVALVAIYVVIVVAGVIMPSLSFFVNVRTHGNGRGIALTFDDGPLPEMTTQVLEILGRYNIPGAFFCIGNRVDANPELVRQIDQSGHIIGNHTYWHGRFFDLKSAPMVTRELYDTDVSIHRVIGKRPRLFRPPYGVTNPMIARSLRRLNHTVVGWSIRSFDTIISDRQRLFSRVTRSLKDGDIILFHDYSQAMIDILPDVIEHIRKSGLEIVRVDKLLNEKPYA